ncbi:YiiX/YebB-like N1pC/P60 family cysteine hydrolase [Stakelama tenebrarum]|uniref:Permuted papain-like amidase enzyme, YaeF/YiiX, C92 family n=1 Tax=Stakelama tenebrarum TaxID=2711215 RepID=A0A6G6Y6D6_9SPHN|nr:YiiX/YebB-like N1pC/P60 family cysteine hydrolase [Sphingosinithalassobacter tenebrarum]QIG80411.1 hypothetical protein G5C33_11910 [Sphingosinithalassobacter tenebrarum]
MPVPDTVRAELPPSSYPELLETLRTGDIILCSGTQLYSRFIRWGAGSAWSHVAMILRIDALDQVMVIEAREEKGVRMLPFHRFLTEDSTPNRVFPGDVVFARHRDFETHAANGGLQRMMRFATDRLGAPFSPGEILKIMARIVLSRLGKRLPRMLRSDDEFTCAEYVYRCLEEVGIHVAWNGLGYIGPAAFARDEAIHPVARLSENPFPEEGAVRRAKRRAASHSGAEQRTTGG